MELFKVISEWIIGTALLLNLLILIPAIITFRANSKAKSAKIDMLENIIALMPGHVYWVDAQGFYLGCNDNQATSAGLASRKAIVGKKNKDLPWNFNAGILPVLDRINQQVIQTGKSILLEEPAILEDGTELIFLSNKVPLYNRNGLIIGMVGISMDITARKKAEAQLQLAKARQKPRVRI